MLKSLIPLLILLAIIAGILFLVQLCFKNSSGGPVAKDGMKKGIIVALLTDSWLLGWLYTKKKTDYDYDEHRLK